MAKKRSFKPKSRGHGAGGRGLPMATSGKLPSAGEMMATDRALGKPGPGLARETREQRYNPFRTITPQRLALALDSFDAGYLREASLIFDALESRVDMIASCAAKRRKAVSRRPWSVVTLADLPKERKTEADAQRTAVKSFFDHLTVTDATDLNVSGGVSLLVWQMMGMKLQKYSAHEILWEPRVNGEGAYELRAELKFVPLYLFENRRGRLAYAGINGYSDGVVCQPGEWIIGTGECLMMAVANAWMLRRLSLQDWIAYSERFGMPGIHGETSAPFGSPEWDAFMDALHKMANDWVIGTTGGAKVNLIESGKTGDQPFKPMVDYCDRLIATLFRGADLSTISRQDGAGASLQGDESLLLQQDDCAAVSEVINLNLTREVVRILFGAGVEPLVYFELQPERPKDTDQEMKVDDHLRKNGVPMGKREMLERYDRGEPSEDDELIEEEQPKETKKGKEGDPDADPETDPEEGANDDPAGGVELENALFTEAELREAGERDTFLAGAQQWIAEARVMDCAPLVADLEAILLLEDEAEQTRRLEEFIASLPEAVGADDAQVAAWEALMGSAFLNGAAEIQEKEPKKSKKGKGKGGQQL